MTIWEISEKADYIARRHQQLQEQWHQYCNSLIQGITLSKARLHHAMSCAAQGDMRFVLFGHFTIFVTLANTFNSHTIEYYVETKAGEKQRIAQAQLMSDGMIDVTSATAIASRCWSTIWKKSSRYTTACTQRLNMTCRST